VSIVQVDRQGGACRARAIDSNGFGASSARTLHGIGIFRRSLEGMSQFCQWLLRFLAKA
jgi:hypothetical protein